MAVFIWEMEYESIFHTKWGPLLNGKFIAPPI